MQARWMAALTMVCALAVVPAAAQDTYVSASLTLDVIRFSRSETPGGTDLSPDGEAPGFALRLGTRLGSAWGVEAEFSRAAEIERESGPDAIPLVPRTTNPALGIIGNGRLAIPGIDPLVFLPLVYRVRTTYRDSTVSAGAWVRQDFTGRFALVYTGGVGFHRSEREAELTVDPIGVVPTGLGLVLPSRTVTDVTTYSARPFAGVEGRLRLSEHVEVVPGVRLHGLEEGLLVRPSIGAAWVF
jgi:hypothetical protein